MEGKVFNPITKRYIKIDGPIYKKLLKTGVIKEKTSTTSYIQDKLKTIVNDFKTRTDLSYVDKEHETFCKTNGKEGRLTQPLKASVTSYQPIMSRCKVVIDAKLTDKLLEYLDEERTELLFEEPKLHDKVSISSNNYTANIARQLYNDYDIDVSWFNRNDEYIKQLSKQDIFTLIGYTNYSHIFLQPFFLGTKTETAFENNMIYSPVDFQKYYHPLFFQFKRLIEKINNLETILKQPNRNITIIDTKNEWTKKAIEWIQYFKHSTNTPLSTQYWIYIYLLKNKQITFNAISNAAMEYKKDLSRIISNSPKTQSRMVVYRGVNSDFYLRGQPSKNLFHAKAFLSTSLKATHATKYTEPFQYHIDKNITGKCCIKRIVIPKNSNVLFITGLSYFPHEMEILLNINSKFYVTSNKRTMRTFKPSFNPEVDVCYDKSETLLVSDLVLLS